MQPTIQVSREGPYYKVQNLHDSRNVVFDFMMNITDHGWWDCKVSHGPFVRLNCIHTSRLERFRAYAERNGIKVVESRELDR